MTNDADKLENARRQGQAQFDSIREMVVALECDYARLEELRDDRTCWTNETESDPGDYGAAFPEKAEELAAADLLELAYARDYTEEQAGRDFWFTRQGHGTGFWDRDELEPEELGDKLSDRAKRFGEVYPEISRGWIYYL
jgi:hypothetical protein